MGVNVRAGTNRSVSSAECGVRSQCVLCGCAWLLRLVVQVYSVAKLWLQFPPLWSFYLHIRPREWHFQGILNS